MPVIRSSETRRSETPAGVMTTLASPTLGGAEHSLWRVEVAPGAPQGPVHLFDVEQVWTFMEGGATIELDGRTHIMESGDTIVIPAAATRRVTGHPEVGFTAVVTAPAGAKASVPGGEGTVPPWIL
ncbi:cupin domain-containing protein [Streptosporangium sp. CA-135522]|uniref:cupin domain-containing protein n=1 Tax=Streptosporangium sp. CA-135522 TaxID=3240072 RepID=UPI003D90D60C